jgi:hypothetical protein
MKCFYATHSTFNVQCSTFNVPTRLFSLILLPLLHILPPCTTAPAQYQEARLAARLLSLTPPEGKAKANRPRLTLSHTIPF